MFNLDRDKQIQINQILQIVKIASLAFPTIAFFQYYSKQEPASVFLTHSFLLASALLVMLSIYSLLFYVQMKMSNHSKLKPWINPLVSLFIAYISVMLTGAHLSNYKYLFLLAIVSCSMESNTKVSLTVSGVSAIIILGIDLFYAPAGSINSYFESDLVLVSIFLIIAWTIGYYVNLERRHIASLNELVKTDSLTGLYNHRYFYDCLADQVDVSDETGNILSLMYLDIDDFKYYNELYGHVAGDEVLRVIADILRKNSPEHAILSRFGGEEFTVLLPDTKIDVAMVYAEDIRQKIHAYAFEGEENMPGESLTVSVGVTSYPDKAKSETDLLKYADDACYRAKFMRKNRVEAYYSILEDLQKNADDATKEMLTSIKTLIAVINAKDRYTFRHVERVVYYCSLVADKQNFSEKDKRNLIYAAYLHDIGKINVPEDVLMKPDRLTPHEWDIMSNHPHNAAEIVRNIDSLKEVLPIILQHHERHDGTGYPNKLKGDEITFLAKVLSVIDSFDAMTSARPYQQKKSVMQAIDELRRCSGAQFDPEAVNLFLDTIGMMVL